MKEIQVLLSSYNGEKYIQEQIDSILAQEGVTVSLLIRDDGSSDGTKEVLEEYARKDSRISLYRNEENNVGTLDAIEKYVNTEYFMVLDHDDYVAPNALEIFYTMAVYFMSVGIKKTRYTLTGALLTTLVGIIVSTILVLL